MDFQQKVCAPNMVNEDGPKEKIKREANNIPLDMKTEEKMCSP